MTDKDSKDTDTPLTEDNAGREALGVSFEDFLEALFFIGAVFVLGNAFFLGKTFFVGALFFVGVVSFFGAADKDSKDTDTATSLSTEDNAAAREAFSVFEDFLACEIQAENDALKEGNNDLMCNKKTLQDVTIKAYGTKIHSYSILEGIDSQDEIMCRGLESIANDDQIGSYGRSQIAKDRNLGRTLTFPIEDTSFTIEAFKHDVEVKGGNVLIPSPSISIDYANGLSRMNDFCYECLHLTLNKDDTVSFCFFQMQAIFKGKVLNIGPKDMEQGIKALAATIGRAAFFTAEVIASKMEGEELDYSFIDGLLHDSPDMRFILESISLPLTQGVQKACDLLQGLESRNAIGETVDKAPTPSTETDSLRRSVAVSTVRGVVVDKLCANKKLHSERNTLLSMGHLFVNRVVLTQGDDTLVEMNLGDAASVSIGGRDCFKFEDIEGVSIELNWLDRFSITVGVNACYQTESKPHNQVIPVENGVRFRYGNAYVVGNVVSKSREDLEVFAQEGIERKMQKCTESGENPGLPNSILFEVNEIVFSKPQRNFYMTRL
ncbi:predicted protein [Chaetoceros tenuissimus]|uniref:Uncharacterized protein n=1 Tax=Chaetoceros tenuissimus TaxID=426638 RepID=A0AAD3D601_9STRA|nr:predicted protein [Chaetoceros tenuissimus]